MKLADLRLNENRFGEHEFDIKGVNLFEPLNFAIYPFTVTVTYMAADGGYDDHPYGNSTAREHHSAEIEVKKVVCAEAVLLRSQDDEDKVLQTIQIGTPIEKIPGYETSMDNWFYEQACLDHDK